MNSEFPLFLKLHVFIKLLSVWELFMDNKMSLKIFFCFGKTLEIICLASPGCFADTAWLLLDCY